MSILSSVFLLLLVAAVGYASWDMFHGDNALEDTERVLISTKSRTKRSADLGSLDAESYEGLTKEFVVHVPYKGQNISLPLLRNDRVTNDLPLFVFNDDGQVERYPTADMNKGKAMYQAQEQLASILVDCSTADDCQLYGTFQHGGERLGVRPSAAGYHEVGRSRRSTVEPGAFQAIDPGTELPVGKPTQRKTNRKSSVSEMAGSAMKYPDVNIVELLLVTDTSEYELYVAHCSNFHTLNAEISLELAELCVEGKDPEKDYGSYPDVPHVPVQRDLKFKSVEEENPDIPIEIFVAGALIARRVKDVPWLRTFDSGAVRGVKTLFAFGQYTVALAESSDTLPHFDHAMAVTRKISFYYDRSLEILGVAFRNVMCRPGFEAYQVSLVRDLNLQLELVMAHELGHSLGAKHDENERCSYQDGYIMQAGIEPLDEDVKDNAWKFSPCSVRAFGRLIERSVGRWNNNCLRDHHFTPRQVRHDRKTPLAGTQHTLDDQCQFRFGHRSRWCYRSVEEKYPDGMCFRGHTCKYRGTCMAQVLPYDGSTCGEDMWCCKGSCVPRPPRSENASCCDC